MHNTALDVELMIKLIARLDRMLAPTPAEREQAARVRAEARAQRLAKAQRQISELRAEAGSINEARLEAKAEADDKSLDMGTRQAARRDFNELGGKLAMVMQKVQQVEAYVEEGTPLPAAPVRAWPRPRSR